jgi:hypothetical protein
MSTPWLCPTIFAVASPIPPAPPEITHTVSKAASESELFVSAQPDLQGADERKIYPSELDRAFPQELAGALVEGASRRRQSHGGALDTAGATGAVVLAAVGVVARGRS